MIRVAPGRRRYDEPHVLIEIDEEGAAYIAQVMRDHQSHDGGAVAIAEEIERFMSRRSVADSGDDIPGGTDA